jgi:hypothetical protein
LPATSIYGTGTSRLRRRLLAASDNDSRTSSTSEAAGIAALDEESDAILRRLADDLESNGFVATASLPACFANEALMERYPSAPVMLTVRPEGAGTPEGASSWARSVQQTVLRAPFAFRRPPFAWIDRTRKVAELLEWTMEELGAPFAKDPDTGKLLAPPTADELEASYLNWNKRVMSTVPPERLVVFKASDGWESLCGPSTALQEAGARSPSVLSQPFPHVNEVKFFQRILGVLNGMADAVEWAPVWMPLVIAAAGSVLVLRRSRRPRRGAPGEDRKSKRQ